MTDDTYFTRPPGELARDAYSGARADGSGDDRDDEPVRREEVTPSPRRSSWPGWPAWSLGGGRHPADLTDESEHEQGTADAGAAVPHTADGGPSPRGDAEPLVPAAVRQTGTEDVPPVSPVLPADQPETHPDGGAPHPALPEDDQEEAYEEAEPTSAAESPGTAYADPEPGPPAAHTAHTAKQFTQEVPPGGLGFQAETQNFYGSDFVRPQPVPLTDLYACADDRFVVPRDSRRWTQAQELLAQGGVVVLCAPPGNGRRTAALRLLGTVASLSAGPLLTDLEPEWSKPDVAKLPTAPGGRYLLDLSEMPEPPGPRFGEMLRGYGETGKGADRYLVVLATPQSWQGQWTEATRPFTVMLPSPDAKPLVTQELRRRGAAHKIGWLEGAAYGDIWESNPPAQDARRLARIIQEATEHDDSAIVDEFRGWHHHIGNLLSPSKQGPGEPTLVATRAMVWAGALVNGGTKRSVIQAADMLLTSLNLSRAPVDILSDATSSRRLEAAHLKPHGDRVFHDRNKHDLAPAVLRHLWEEFPTQRDLLRTWAVAVAADQSLPEDDARLVMGSLLNLATEVHDNTIIDRVGRDLAGRRRSLAVEVLTHAALDPEIGRYVRNRLYQWMTAAKPPAELIALVTEICGGELAVHQPAIAMTRLARAAAHAAYPSQPMAEAFRKLSEVNPAEVARALKSWLGEEQPKRHALVAFLALASSDVGARLLLDTASEHEGRVRFVRAWQQLLGGDDDARDAAETELTRWGVAAEKGDLPADVLTDLLADVYEPEVHRSSLKRFFARDEAFQQTFWGRILEQAIIRNHERRKAATG
ncbi:hypothetical protein ABZ442_01285 [Streptomyces triculaminicus]|uniref:hypothetical protein n=1 Tax=Streptomyces triculaminicus TaxID=2816232 RepID=UPI0034077F0F